jgi:hypothetical protein
MHTIHHRYADIGGQQLFYREAGAADHRIDIRVTRRHPGRSAENRLIADSTRPTALSES